MLLGHLANLPDAAPDADDFREQIRAAEAAAADVPRGTEDAAPAPMMPLPGSTFAVGTKVRDKLSGQTGTVTEAPGGEGMDWGGVVFVKSDADGQTHPMAGEFLEQVPTAPPVVPMVTPPGAPAMEALPAPGPGGAAPAAEGAPAPGSPIPEKPSKTTNAAFRQRLINARMAKPATSSRPAAAPQPARVNVTAAATQDDPIITRPNDARRLRYSEMVAKLKAKPQPTHHDALTLVGYVPANWDQLVSRLMGDGVVLRSQKASFDVAAMVKAKFMESEIRYVLGCKGVPMYALDRAFKAIRGALPPVADRPYTADDIKAFRQLYELGTEFTDADVKAEMHQFTAEDLPVGFAKIKADAPTIPMPTEDPGNGMSWAWDKIGKKWYQTPKAG